MLMQLRALEWAECKSERRTIFGSVDNSWHHSCTKNLKRFQTAERMRTELTFPSRKGNLAISPAT